MNKKAISELARLISDNPDLPVYACVDGDVCGGDYYAHWIGRITRCYVDEYAIEYWAEGKLVSKDDKDDEEELIESYAIYTDADYEVAKREVSKMWEKAIFVTVSYFDEE